MFLYGIIQISREFHLLHIDMMLIRNEPMIMAISDLGESADLGNTFWQENFGKKEKTHLGRGFNKPSTEVLISRPRFYQALDRGSFKPSTEVFTNPRSSY